MLIPTTRIPIQYDTLTSASCASTHSCPQAFKKLVTDESEVEGLPPTALGLAAQQARSAGHEAATAETGPWLLTLDFPSYYPVMTNAKHRCAGAEQQCGCGCFSHNCVFLTVVVSRPSHSRVFLGGL